MAIRVKKLARELRQSPAQVLGLLHHLGFPRYKSPEDMVATPAAEQARKAARKGVKAPPVALPERARSKKKKKKKAPAGAAPPADDLMAQLVPGVVPQRERRRANPAPPPATPRESQPTTPAARPAAPVTSAPAAPGADDVLASARAELDAQRQELADLRAALEAERRALEEERQTFETARAEAEAASGEIADDSLLAVLQARGLRGTDEAERALGALAAHHQLGPVLGELTVRDPGRLLRRLRDRLALVGGDVHESLGVAAVTVSPDRAELPTAAELDTLVDRFGEQLLLNGLKRARVAGVPLRWHGLLQRTDDRIELQLQPAHERGASAADADIAEVDVLFGWNLPVTDEARALYDESRLRVFLGEQPTFVEWLKDVIESLAS